MKAEYCRAGRAVLHLDGGQGGAEARPRKDAHAQIDGRGIECIDHLFRFHRKAVSGVKFSGGLDQARREIHVDATVALLVGIGQRALGDVASYAQVIELLLGGHADRFRYRADFRGKSVARKPCKKIDRDVRT